MNSPLCTLIYVILTLRKSFNAFRIALALSETQSSLTKFEIKSLLFFPQR